MVSAAYFCLKGPFDLTSPPPTATVTAIAHPTFPKGFFFQNRNIWPKERQPKTKWTQVITSRLLDSHLCRDKLLGLNTCGVCRGAFLRFNWTHEEDALIFYKLFTFWFLINDHMGHWGDTSMHLSPQWDSIPWKGEKRKWRGHQYSKFKKSPLPAVIIFWWNCSLVKNDDKQQHIRGAFFV